MPRPAPATTSARWCRGGSCLCAVLVFSLISHLQIGCCDERGSVIVNRRQKIVARCGLLEPHEIVDLGRLSYVRHDLVELPTLGRLIQHSLHSWLSVGKRVGRNS